MSNHDPSTSSVPTYDAVVVGGGPAGLQAALTLGRVHRSVLLLDSGRYRNEAASGVHNFLTHDGTPPAVLRAAALAELAAYPTVEHRPVAAHHLAAGGGAFRADLADGTTVRARGLVLATGVRDTLPSTPGLAELWGDVVAHCPFCHGHEHAGQHVAVLGAGDRAGHLARLLGPVAGRLTVLTDGAEPDTGPDTGPDAGLPAGVAVRREPVAALERTATGARVCFADGSSLDVGAVFVPTAISQAAPFAEQLGLRLLPSGSVEVDAMGRTSLPRVHAAGDMAHTAALPMPMQSVLAAAAAGQLAAGSLVAALLEQ